MPIQLQSPLDMHLHMREGAMLQTVAPLSAGPFAGALIMPNLSTPVDSLDRLLAYRAAIEGAVGGATFQPYMTLFFRHYSEAELRAAQPHIIGIKLYPAGVTTNSADGVQQLATIDPTLALMEQLGIPLLVHGETHDFVLDREERFLTVYDRIAHAFPRLTIVMEHITTQAAADFLDRHPNIYATVTLHHLLITLDDLAGGLLSPHLFCKPLAKRPEDRAALLELALRAHPKLMFGSDSAPHPLSAKECSGCAAGVFTAPVILPALTALFAQHGALDQLQDFISGNAQRIYKISPLAKIITLEQRPWRVPERYGDVVPFLAGQQLEWMVVQEG